MQLVLQALLNQLTDLAHILVDAVVPTLHSLLPTRSGVFGMDLQFITCCVLFVASVRKKLHRLVSLCAQQAPRRQFYYCEQIS